MQGCPASRAACCWRTAYRPEPRSVYFIYSFLMGLAALLLAPYWLVQVLRHGKYLPNLGERLGFSFPALAKLPPHSPATTWIHPTTPPQPLSTSTLSPPSNTAH